MQAKRLTAAIAGALVAGVVLGSVVSGYAAAPKATTTAPPSGIVGACGAAGLRLGAAVRDGGGRILDVVAKLTGTSAADVQTQRQSGMTFAQIAAAQNVDSAAVVAEALKVRQALLAEKVKAGDITQAQSDAALANMKTRITTRVNSANAGCDGSGGGMGRGRGAGGGGGCGANCGTTAQ